MSSLLLWRSERESQELWICQRPSDLLQARANIGSTYAATILQPQSSEASMSNSLAGYAALITGGASGLGQSHARVLGSRGAKVAITDLDQAQLERARGELARDGVEALCLKADNRRVGEVASAVA